MTPPHSLDPVMKGIAYRRHRHGDAVSDPWLIAEGLRQIEPLGFAESFTDCLYRHLQDHVRQPPSLEQAVQAFAISPATLKRKLRKHNTGFQQQVDLARKHVALYLYQVKGMSNEEVAEYLSFSDAANFRRSFKRWTGSTPHLIRQLSGSH